MNLRLWLQPPRRALGVFLAMSLGLTAGLAWLGSQVVALDRNLERQRTQERVGHALDLVSVSLDRWVDQIDRVLAAAAATPDVATFDAVTIDAPEAEAPVYLVFGRSGLRAVPEGRLAYYPERASGDAHAPISSSSEATHAMSLLVEAGSLNRSGKHDAALTVYDQLAALPVTVPVLDAPAPIVARHARSLIFDALGRRDDLQHEARRLQEVVRDPRYHLTRRVYDFYSGKARLWSGPQDTAAAAEAAEAMRLARAAIASELSDAWRRDAAPASGLVARTVRVDTQPMVVLERRGTEALAAFVAPTQVLVAEVRRALDPDAHQIVLSLLDSSGQAIVGAPPSSAPQRVTRLAGDAGLPWTLTAAPAPGWVPDGEASARQRLVVLGVFLVAVTVVAAAWMAGRSMHRELEAARLQSDFVAAVSHEFRTPLAAFGQITELLADGRIADESDRDEYYRRLQHETGRLSRLVEDLLDFRRMEVGAHEYRFEPVEVEVLVRDIVDECQPNEGDHRPRLEFVVPESCGIVRADREALARAVRNLIDNALKYAAGTPVVRVVVSRVKEDVAIGVHDSGPGIAPEHQRTIFDKFVRAGSRQAAVRGTGLGLAMVRHIVQAHGGRITLDSATGRGSTFTIVLRAVDETAPSTGSA
jgi:two-component system phosphate regulon sensor histidine kinase PhoR